MEYDVYMYYNFYMDIFYSSINDIEYRGVGRDIYFDYTQYFRFYNQEVLFLILQCYNVVYLIGDIL